MSQDSQLTNRTSRPGLLSLHQDLHHHFPFHIFGLTSGFIPHLLLPVIGAAILFSLSSNHPNFFPAALPAVCRMTPGGLHENSLFSKANPTSLHFKHQVLSSWPPGEALQCCPSITLLSPPPSQSSAMSPGTAVTWLFLNHAPQCPDAQRPTPPFPLPAR